MILVDTNVLVDMLEDDARWASWSVAQLRAQSQVHQLAINAVIYAELSLAFDRYESLDRTLDDLDVAVLEIPRPALFLAGRAFVRYRSKGGGKSNVLPDFFIGAHAAVAQCAIVTRDAQRYASYFPSVPLIQPVSN